MVQHKTKSPIIVATKRKKTIGHMQTRNNQANQTHYIKKKKTYRNRHSDPLLFRNHSGAKMCQASPACEVASRNARYPSSDDSIYPSLMENPLGISRIIRS